LFSQVLPSFEFVYAKCLAYWCLSCIIIWGLNFCFSAHCLTWAVT
jgi:hypothetical protein